MSYAARQRAEELDSSFDGMLGGNTAKFESVHLKRSLPSYNVDDADVSAAATRSKTNQDIVEEEEEGRDERRSPAAVLSTKRIGMIRLPEALVEKIEEAIDGKSHI